jgi:hypothetical protein
MTLDEKIEVFRTELRSLKEEEERKLAELRTLFIEKAEVTCPILIGTKVEYEPGKFGRVDRIGYDVELLHELDAGAEVYWNVSGKKINKTGKFGVKDFSPVGSLRYFVEGTKFKFKDIGGIFGITEPDDD